jgi:hypothetical protein
LTRSCYFIGFRKISQIKLPNRLERRALAVSVKLIRLARRPVRLAKALCINIPMPGAFQGISTPKIAPPPIASMPEPETMIAGKMVRTYLTMSGPSAAGYLAQPLVHQNLRSRPSGS